MTNNYLLALSSLRKMRPFLSNELYDALMVAISERDDILGARTKVIATARAIAVLPDQMDTVFCLNSVSVRYVFKAPAARSLYILQRPKALNSQQLLLCYEIDHGSCGPHISLLSLSEILEQGGLLDFTFEPTRIHDLFSCAA